MIDVCISLCVHVCSIHGCIHVCLQVSTQMCVCVCVCVCALLHAIQAPILLFHELSDQISKVWARKLKSTSALLSLPSILNGYAV